MDRNQTSANQTSDIRHHDPQVTINNYTFETIKYVHQEKAAVKPIPDGASVVIPRLVCSDPLAMIEFCKTAFRAVEVVRRPGSDGSIAHALVTISGAMVMIESEWPGMANKAPKMDGTSP